MADRTDRERIISLESRVLDLEVRLGELTKGVVLVQKIKPGRKKAKPKIKTYKSEMAAKVAEKLKASWAKRREREKDTLNT